MLSKTERIILELSKKYNLSHLGSCFSSLEIIENLYKNNSKVNFILSAGHSGLALYSVLEVYLGISAEELYLTNGCHPHRGDHILCSTGSLGMGITIAVGLAIANPDNEYHCLISDGECAEGSVWEALQFIYNKNIVNLKIHVNVNGYAAYDNVNVTYLVNRLRSFLPNIEIHFTRVNRFPFLSGLNAHYHIMSQEDYDGVI